MDAVLGLLFLGGIVAMVTMMSNARTKGRKLANARTRTSLSVVSALGWDELGRIVANGLARGGAEYAGSFDNESYFRIRGGPQLTLTVADEGGYTRADVSLGSVRNSNGRPQRLHGVGQVLNIADRYVREADPSAQIR